MIQGRLLVHMTAGRRLAVRNADDDSNATLYADVGGLVALGTNIITADNQGTASAYCSGRMKLVEVSTSSVVRGEIDVIPLQCSPVTFGADGVDDTAAVQLAITAAGGIAAIDLTVDTPTQVSGATMLQTAAATDIRGRGENTLLTITEQSATGVSYAFDMGADGLSVSDMSVAVDKDLVGVSTLILASPEYDDLTLRNLRFDGATALVSGTQDRSIQIVKASTTAAIEGVTIAGNDFENVARVYTRDNANTVAHKRIKAFFNLCKKVWRTAYTFNAPSGSIEDVLVIGDTFDTHEGVVQGDSGIAGNHNAIGFVGVRGGRAIGNHVTGKFGAVLHVEENTDGVAAIGNTARMANPASTDGAMETLANNVGGSTVVPKHQAWIGNVLQSTDGVGKGLYLQSQASGDATQWSVVANNISDAFDEAYRVDTDARSVLVANNVLKGAVNAAEMTRASLLFNHNLVQVVAEPIHLTRGGMVGAVHYANLSSETGGITAFGASAGGPLVLTEWTWETGLFAIDTGTTYLNIGPMPTRAYGTFSIVLSFNASIHRHLEVLFEYDGATITNTTRITYGSGAITSLAPANNAGSLAITLTNGGALTAASARIQVRFHSGQFIV